jgi:hypothetical protein
LLEIAEQEINVQTALVGFIDDQRVILAKQGITLRLGQKNAIGHQLDPRAVGERVMEAHLVAHMHAGRCPQLLCDALGGG